MVAAVMALSSYSYTPVVESLAFDVSSRSSSAFTTSRSEIISHGHSYCHPSSSSSSTNSILEMKVSSGSAKRSRSKSSRLIELNNERLRTAGRPGTKKFMDPNKVFLGNLPYDATEDDVIALFSSHWNVPLDSVGDRIESVKIIREWKTGKSKGYGFVQFYEPMVATSAMESINKGQGKGWRIKGRRIRLDQGQRKDGDVDMREKKKQKQKQQRKEKLEREAVLDEEGMVIHSALEEAAGADGAAVVVEEEDDDDGGMSEDEIIAFMEKGGLRGVMPLTEETAGFLGIEGLYDDDDEDGDYFGEFYNENGYDDGDFGDIEEDGEDDDDDDETAYDGVFEEMYNPKEYEGLSEEEEASIKEMNREQRRAADKRRKKRKLPFKGFGSSN